ncbi:MAG: hypothetical protein KDC26_04570 [Armatimonadetes bacterium]|nr:hypothetical protein [Armatimonadota bacterium]
MKDFRIQMRGNKALILWSLYLVLLVLFAMFTYGGVASQMRAGMSAAEMQSRLQSFYNTLMYLLQTAIILIAPVLASASIVADDERGSIDLVLMAPKSSTYYFAGLVMSGMRQLIFLLALSIPVASLGVIMGGATWTDVLRSFTIFLFQGLFYMCLGVPVAVSSRKMVPTVIGSYVAIAVGSGILALMNAIMSPAMLSGMMGGPTTSTPTMPLFSVLTPYWHIIVNAPMTAVTPTFLIPTWAATILMSTLGVAICMLGSASQMSRAGSPAVIATRIVGLIISLLIGLLTSQMFSTIFGIGGASGTSAGTSFMITTALSGFMLSGFIMLIIVANVVPYAFRDGEKYFPNGMFSVKDALKGKPAGGMTYALFAFACLFGPSGYYLFRGMFVSTYTALEAFAVMFWFLCAAFLYFGIFRFTSPWNGSVKSARRIGVLFIVGLNVGAGMLLAMVDLAFKTPGTLSIINPMHPFAETPEGVIAKGIVLAIVGGILVNRSEERRIKHPLMKIKGRETA